MNVFVSPICRRYLPVLVISAQLIACVPQQNVKQSSASTSAAKSSEQTHVAANKDYQSDLQSQAYWLDRPKTVDWKQASSELPESPLYNWMLNELSAYKGNVEQSLPELARLAEELNQPEAYKRVANIAFYAKDDQTAYNMVSRWLLLEPEQEQARRMALNLEIERAQLNLPDARNNIQTHIDWLLKHGDDPMRQRFLDLVAQLGQQRNKKLSLELMESVVEAHPNNADAHAAYGNLAVLFNQADTARKALSKALEIDPKQSNAIILLSQLRYRKGDVKGALAQLSQAVKHDPKNVSLRNNYARMLVNSKQYKKARYQYEYLLEDNPSDESILFTLGILSIDNKDYERAKTYFDRLQGIGTRQNEANFYLGRIAEVQEKYQDAISNYLSVYGGSYLLESRFRATWSYAAQKNYAVAYQLLRDLREQDDKAVKLRTYAAEGQLLRQEGRYQDAFDLYTLAIEKHPDNNDLLYARSLVSEKVGRLDVLERDLRAILKREPDNADALNALGYALLNLTQRYDEAFQLIKQALQLEPDSGAIMDSYGWALYRKGQYEDALIYLRKAFEIIPDPEIAAHLGEVLWVTGDKKAAEQIWNDALKQVPDDETVLRTINRLKNQ